MPLNSRPSSNTTVAQTTIRPATSIGEVATLLIPLGRMPVACAASSRDATVS
jgi:hypothetical protein